MSKPDAMAIRRKIMGVVLRTARLEQGRTLEDCAQVVQLSAAELEQVERGERDLSLPQLEALSAYLQLQVSDVLAGQLPARERPRLASPQAHLVRRKIIGTLLRKGREEAGQSIDQVAAQLGLAPELLTQYERGQVDIPVLQLQRLSELIGVPFHQLLEAPATAPAPVATTGDNWGHLGPEQRAFLASPHHLPYLQIAMEISRFSPEGLKAIAHALLAAQPPA